MIISVREVSSGRTGTVNEKGERSYTRTFQVIIGLSLLSYATNLFIFGMGRLKVERPPIIGPDGATDPSLYADPVPQALVLTAIVIGFATTALFLVVLLALRGLSGTDHVDGRERDS